MAITSQTIAANIARVASITRVNIRTNIADRLVLTDAAVRSGLLAVCGGAGAADRQIREH